MSVTADNKDVALSCCKDAQYAGFTDKTAVKFTALPAKCNTWETRGLSRNTLVVFKTKRTHAHTHYHCISSFITVISDLWIRFTRSHYDDVYKTHTFHDQTVYRFSSF